MADRDLTNIYRILDVSANRAREALRVAEEAARFALERPDLAEALKRLRHDLRAALAPLDARRQPPGRPRGFLEPFLQVVRAVSQPLDGGGDGGVHDLPVFLD